MATAGALEPSTCGGKRKEVVVSYMTTDSPHDASENPKTKILLTTSMSSFCGEVISFVDCDDKTEFMTLKPREISKIVEPGKKYLCLEYGPKRKANFIFLDFRDETREKLDEWHDFLCRMMGSVSNPQRRYTGIARTLQKRKSPSKRRIVSAIQPSITPISKPENDESLIGDSTSDWSSLSSSKSTRMLDVGANQAEIPMAILKSFYSQRNVDSAYLSDEFEKYKRENCFELRGRRLNCYEKSEPDHYTITTVVEVERKRGTNILSLRCGPGCHMFIFLEFNSKQLMDEWQEALCRCTGQPYDPTPNLRRVRSELPAVVRRRRRRAIILPASCDELVDLESEQVEPSSETSQDAPLEAHQEAPPAPAEAPPEDPSAPRAKPVARPSPQAVPSEERGQSFTSETSETDTRPDSLRLHDAYLSPKLADLANNPLKKEFNLSDLQQLKVKDCGGDVIVSEVTKPNPLCDLHVGDIIVSTNARGLPMNARELTEHLRTSINLTIVRGAVCTPREEGHELAIDIKGSQQVDSDSEKVETSSETPQEAPLEAPPAPRLAAAEGAYSPPVASPSPQSLPSEERVQSLRSETSETDSRPDILRSRDADLSPTLADLAKNSVEKEFNLSDLQQLKIKDYKGDVIVAKAIPRCQLHLGDKIVLRNDRGFPMNAQEMTTLIQTSPEQTSARLDTVDLIRRACTSCCSLPYTEMQERSKLTITEINNIPVDIGSQPDQIAKNMREALESSREDQTIHRVPQSLLDYLAEEEDDTHEEQTHDMVDEEQSNIKN